MRRPRWFPNRIHSWILLVGLALFAAGCGTPPNQPAALQNATMLLTDGTDAEWQYTFLIEDRNVLLMIESVAGNKVTAAQPKFYAATAVPLELYQTLRQLSGIAGSGIVHDPARRLAYERAIYLHPIPGDLPPAPQEVDISAYSQVATQMKKLRDFVLQKDRAIAGLPNWAFRNEVVTRRLNFEGR